MPVRFGDLPPADVERRGGRKWDEEAAELRSRPDEWAMVATRSTRNSAVNFAHNIRRGMLIAFAPRGWFEATAHGTDVWARYVGNGTPDAE